MLVEVVMDISSFEAYVGVVAAGWRTCWKSSSHRNALLPYDLFIQFQDFITFTVLLTWLINCSLRLHE